MSAIQQIEVNGTTIKDGTEFVLQEKTEQLAEDIIERAEDIHSEDPEEIANDLEGETLTVAGIKREVDGTHIEFTTALNEDNPTPIMQFAVENMLRTNHLEPA